MMRVSHSTLYKISGLVWLVVGIMLLNTGLVLFMKGFETVPFSPDLYSSFFMWVAGLINGPDRAAMLLIGISVALGFCKGRFVMQKAVARSYDRIKELENPTKIFNIYSRANIFLILAMVFLGMSMKYLSIPVDVRAIIDTAVGCALMQGAVGYFHYAAFAKKSASN